MIRFIRKIIIAFTLLFLFFAQNSFSQDQDVLEILEIIQKDLKTLEKAVYSDAGSEDLRIKTEFNQNDEDVLTRHLLKLSEIEEQLLETLEHVNSLSDKHEQINKLIVFKKAWTEDSGFFTPTMKLKRHIIDATFKESYFKWEAMDQTVIWID